MSEVGRYRDLEGRLHWAAPESKKIRDGLADGSLVDIDAPDPTASEPPRSGAGSGVEAWRHYATTQGVDVTDDMSRTDVMAAVDASREADSEASTGQRGDDLDTGNSDGAPGVGERTDGSTN